ncbi:GntR family transcriptional regulator [Sphingopyxis sp.]|uniref:GntR family transcriptional regulator n=1 Tax=Sphingopyxis sp. TaxID=1908224 RepID=UPI001DF00831|nr:GntR family transcriptional regulator [Sphingopyxis sp.]MBW8296300.1 GntR family transcriptional regulator [Sphingopyxis sp.]
MNVPAVVKLHKQTFGARIADELRKSIFAGEIAPGEPLVETALAEQFGVSRGPLREAIRQLIDEGLLIQVPFTGTHVTELSEQAVREIYSLRTTLETFAFRLAWGRRDEYFRSELQQRQVALLEAIDAGDELECIRRELHLHSLVYETADHLLLLEIWNGLKGRLQLYWASNHLAHGRRGPRRGGHDSFLVAALGDDWDAMEREIETHMRLGGEETERYLKARNPEN